ncbi:MAG: hypothetical protein JSS35_09260 [Proteobacteria bacterium]|nr:hypothetical protein [Pseudomonadota bacterium]
MKDIIAALLLAGPATIPVPVAPGAAAPITQSLERETRLSGVDVACAGIGRQDRSDPHWATYNVRVEVSNPRAEYLAGATLVVRDMKGRVLLSAGRCDAPWVLLRLPAGAYVVEAKVEGTTRSARIAAPKVGQQRVVLQFPDA